MNRHSRNRLIRQVETYLAFYALLDPANPHSHMRAGERIPVEKINAYGLRKERQR